jgi:uncharacterized protein (TIGR00251 family)
LALRLSVTVAPGAKRSAIVGRHGDGWKVRIAAAPEHGRANDALEKLLAGALGVHPSGVRITSGHGSRRKVVEVEGLEARTAAERLEAAAQDRS